MKEICSFIREEVLGVFLVQLRANLKDCERRLQAPLKRAFLSLRVSLPPCAAHYNRRGFRKWGSSLRDDDGSWEKALREQLILGSQVIRDTWLDTAADRKCPSQGNRTQPLTLLLTVDGLCPPSHTRSLCFLEEEEY